MIKESVIEGDIDLDGVYSSSAISVVGSKVTGRFIGDGLRCELALDLNSTQFEQEVSLKYAKVGNYLSLAGPLSWRCFRRFASGWQSFADGGDETRQA